ncbi:hypothetical protein ACP4OV_021978 [Aristida adscensionis]
MVAQGLRVVRDGPGPRCGGCRRRHLLPGIPGVLRARALLPHDEHYLPTLLSVLGWPLNANRSLTHADWSERGAVHPWAYRRQDATAELIEGSGAVPPATTAATMARWTCFLFARKFAPDTVQPLLALAPKIRAR